MKFQAHIITIVLMASYRTGEKKHFVKKSGLRPKKVCLELSIFKEMGADVKILEDLTL